MNEVNTSGGVLNPFFRPPEPEIPTKLPNPQALKFTGGSTASYDGSKAVSVAIPAIKDITSGVTAIGDHVISGTYAVQIDKVVIMTMAITLGTSTGGWNEIARLPVTPERGVSTKLALFSDTNLDCNVTTTGVVRAFFSASYTGRHGAFTIVFPVK